MTSEQSAALDAACLTYNQSLAEDEPQKTSQEYFDWVISVWQSQNPSATADQVELTRQRALNSYVELYGA